MLLSEEEILEHFISADHDGAGRRGLDDTRHKTRKQALRTLLPVDLCQHLEWARHSHSSLWGSRHLLAELDLSAELIERDMIVQM